MGNSCCTPSASSSGQISRQNYTPAESSRPSTEVPRRSSSHSGATSLPISPRRSSTSSEEAADNFSGLPTDVQHHIGSLLPRTTRSALRQTSQTINQALPRNERDVMHPIEGVHALLDMHQGTPIGEVSLAVGRAIQAAQNLQDWQSRGRLLVAARHTVQQFDDHPDQAQMLQQIETAVQASGLTAAQWSRTNGIFTQMLHARGNA
ncbi:hypothetical protein [Acidovorax sp. NCPPB 4044]|uniref:hypothetical protein n=1 Tax=Acidovorax sp. NCPPB 4044 TaxID=2940490 RepID=UPI002303DCDB|nr:hypothetical protein [Acidovorax sp. NCPPB 4044]MDA8523051.1 hypothetical protein [Acidovorax sp. NCPPB 4044]